MAKCSLRNSIAHRRNSERASLVGTRFRNIHAPNHLHLVSSLAQVVFQFANMPYQVRCEIFDRNMIYTGSTLVGSYLAVCGKQVLGLVDLVDQTMPFASSNTVEFQCGQHRIGPDTRFGPLPAGAYVFGRFSLSCFWLLGHLTRLVFQDSVLSRIYLPASLRSTGITLLQSSYECSDFRFGESSCVLMALWVRLVSHGRSACPKRGSLLNASKLLSIPSPTTPRRPEDRFVLSPWLTSIYLAVS